MRNPPLLLVLAASTYQLPFIRAAKERGYRVLTVDNRPANPGHRLADLSVDCDTTDVPALVAIARRFGVNGVVAAATDVALDGAAHIAEALDLPGPRPACARALTRKLEFRRLQSQLGLPAPAFAEGLADVTSEGPWIVKPNRASGSKGIRIVERGADLGDAWTLACSESVDANALVESWLPGVQCTLEGILRAGRIVASMPTRRITASAPAVGTRGHRTPACIPESALEDLVAQVEYIFDSLGHRDGPFDADFVVENERATVIELSPRAGGNSLVHMLKHAAGFDMPDYVVQAALGRTQAIDPFRVQPAALDILSVDRDGTLDYAVDRLDEVRRMPGVALLELDTPPGAIARRFVDGRDRVGELLVTGETTDQVEAYLAAAHAALDIRSN